MESGSSSPHSQVNYVSSQFNMLLIVNYFGSSTIGQEVRPNINLFAFRTNSNVKLLTYSLHALRLRTVIFHYCCGDFVFPF